ncbi:MAG: tetratricopeptide repeat protein, partial [Chloroflexi bacterium]|nr:tetratricopeptide repeat protein [Chloroflexota bacterium]
AIQGAASQEAASEEVYRRVLLAALVSAIVAHFVEINFGIAIAATRTYFWAYAALLVVLGLRAIPLGQDEAGNGLIPSVANPGPGEKAKVLDKMADRAVPSHRRRRSRARSSPTPRTDRYPSSYLLSRQEIALLGALGASLGVILLTLAWDYTTNSLALTNPLAILLTALTTMAASQNAEQISLGMLWIVLSTFALGTMLAVAQVATLWTAEAGLQQSRTLGPTRPRLGAAKWVTAIGLVAAVAGIIGGLFALVHAANLAPGVDVPNLIYEYYLTIGVLWVGLAIFLYAQSPEAVLGGQSASRDTATRISTFAIYGLLFVVCLLFVDSANIRIVKADVIYKQGLRYDRAANWEQAIRFYEQAVEAAPSEDYYRLFYGRALMERAKLEKDEALRNAYFEKALRALAQARELNPLNTDHTANLARIYRTWAEYDADPAKRQEKLEKALELYAQAIELSPNNAQLWDEWGLVHYMLGDLDGAMAKYEHSLKLDPQYAQTYLFMGEVHLKRREWQKVIETHERALELEGNLIQAWSTVGYAYSQLGNWQKAIEANEKVLARVPDDYGTIKNIAILYNQAQKYDQALIYARRALELAPEKDRETIARFVAQLEGVQSPVSEAHKTAP